MLGARWLVARVAGSPQPQSMGCPGLLGVGGVVVAQEYSPSSGFFRDSMGTSPARATTGAADRVSGAGVGTAGCPKCGCQSWGLVSRPPLRPRPLSRQERHFIEDFVEMQRSRLGS